MIKGPENPLQFGPSLNFALALRMPAGWLVLRTMSSGAAYALATSMATRAGAEYAAAHQICLQIWLASSLLADSLAVAAQTLLARSIASSDTGYSQKVVSTTVSMAFVLGLFLTVVLALPGSQLTAVFTKDPMVLQVIDTLLPFVLLTQPLNALAFVGDGVLFGAGGFKYASMAMAVCSAVSAAVMIGGQQLAGADPLLTLSSTWYGLSTFMLMRALTIYVPYKYRNRPVFGRVFDKSPECNATK